MVFGLSSLFGGGSKTTTQPTGFETLPTFAQDALRQAIESGTGLFQQPGLFGPAQFDPLQTQALGTFGSDLFGPLTPEFLGGQLDLFQDPFQEQVIQGAVGDIERFGRGQRSLIGQGASAAGGFGGSRQAIAESELDRNLLQQVGRTTSGLRSQGFQSAIQNALSGINLGRQGAAQQLAAGTIGQEQATALQQAPITAAQFLAQLTGAVPSGGGTIQKGGDGGGLGSSGLLALSSLFSGGGGAAAGAGAAGAGAAAGSAASLAAFSDRRLKHNIHWLRKEKDFNIYRYEYSFQPGVYEGVMADEVERTRPELVQYVGDYKTVNYNGLGLELKRVA